MPLRIHRPTRASAASAGRRLVVLVAVAAVLGVVPALPAVGTPPSADVHRVRIDDWTSQDAPRRPSATGDVWLRSPVVPVEHVVAVGADWGGDADVTVQVRSRRDGRWGRWTALRLAGDHAPDPGTPEATRANPNASEPLWLGSTEAVQVRRLGGGPGLGLDLHAITVSGGDGLAYRPSRMARGAAAHAAPSQPAIHSREAWGADESIRRFTPYYAEDVRFGVVHHTAGRNDYSCAESDDIVRAIYEYHVNVRGWDDIGYNFLVDRCGQIFEGRSGGVTEPVVGAHAAGWNRGSTSVSAMGNFNLTEPPQAMVDALDEVLAWKLDLHHVDPFGATEELAGGGSSNRFERNQRLTLPAIIGHRVTNATSCPGDNLVRHIVEEHPEHPYDEPTRRWSPVASKRVEPIGIPKAYGGPPADREQPLTGHRPRWDTAFTEPLNWRLTIHDTDGQLIRSTGGVEESEVDLAWDLLDGDGEPVEPGTYTAELTAWSTEPGEATPVRTTLDVTAAADRVAGLDRVETALELSRWSFESASRVVIATAGTYADALTATPLAGSFGAPVLLSPRDGLPDEVAAEIQRLHAEEAWIVGGEAALSGRVATDLVDKAGIAPDEVHRLAGADRFETSYEVADTVLHREGATEVLVALGRHPVESRAFPDALSAGGLGAAFDLPIVLVEEHALPPATRRFLDEHALEDGVRLFGGTAAISDGVERLIGDITGVEIRRFAGADRYDTSRLAAEDALRRWDEWEAEHGGRSPYLEGVGLEVVAASGANWPDALGAGAAADERRRSLFLLAPPDEIDGDGATARFLSERADIATHAVVAGGEAAVSSTVREQLDRLIRLGGPHTAPAEEWPEDPHATTELPLPGPTISPVPSPSATALATSRL